MLSSLKKKVPHKIKLYGLITLSIASLLAPQVKADTRQETLIVLSGASINSLDIHRTGTNRPSYQVAVNMYDRLVSFGIKESANGSLKYDSSTIKPELAESWELVDDGMSYLFHIRKDATFWDGSPVTADDVKWSFDRAISLGGFPTVQMKAGGLTSPEQFVVVDKHTFKVKMFKPSKLTLPDLAVPIPMVINSTLAKKHATKDDPWATEYLHKTPAGGGAYMLERWVPGQQLVYKRFDDWKSGDLPKMKRVIVREVPSSATRRALIERGDADVALGLPSKDVKELMSYPSLKVSSSTIDNTIHALGLNMNFEPFSKTKVRQAIAYAIPYQEIFDVAAYGMGKPMWGRDTEKATSILWPQPFPYNTNLEKAKSLLAEAGYPNGFEVPISINLGFSQWTEPTALLIQENLKAIGISAPVNKIPGASWRTKALVEKGLELHLKNFGGWLNYPDYYFFWAYIKGHLFNSMNYDNPEIKSLVDSSLHMEVTDSQYDTNVKRLIDIATDEVPMIPLWQPSLDVVMKSNVSGYVNWFHRQLDIRAFSKE
ncbi:ABC transporter substrate-binding protein [Marinomonas sp. C2222]|uniref:ABC transporter substrate-binding protein n=1 Tax=Marinomonas sargassi TaxID=2984494 RepID=A0ABT2YV90_9GAMM|nr:ABC transporter substrate-binding protein [Marinomonas sargassi]MCV2403499.1 ABC transporter substrate-binding protein [Marinomonas sargassi]